MATKREITWVNVTIPAGDVATIRRIIGDAYKVASGRAMPDGQLFTTRNIKGGIIGFDSDSMPAAVVQRLLAAEVQAKTANAAPAPRIAAVPTPASNAAEAETAQAWIEHIRSGAGTLASVRAGLKEWPGVLRIIEATLAPPMPVPPMPVPVPVPVPPMPAMPEAAAPQDGTAAILAALAQMGERLAMVEAKRGPGRPAKVKAA
jgi:hypothetical protein